MTDAEESRFAHPIGNIILDELVEGEVSEYALDEEGAEIILKAATEAFDAPDSDVMVDVIIEVAAFLDTQDGAEASARLQAVLKQLEAIAEERGLEFPGFDDDDEVEATFGRRAAAIVGKKTVHVAPKLGEDKPEGTLNLQALIGTKRRM